MPKTTVIASTAQESGKARIHFLFFKKFTTGDLIQAYLNLSVEPAFLSQHAVDCFGDEIAGAATCLRGKMLKRRLLLF
jgi:hypothetical protein